MKKSLHLVQLTGLSVYEQLQLEEALLRVDERDWCIVNKNASSSIVMGISGILHELVDVEHLKNQPLSIIRRYSGGGTVVVDQNTLFISFICNASFANVPAFPKSIMKWTEELYYPLFQPHPFAQREHDYVLGQKKVGGNAQSITKERWSHHTSWLWDYSPELMKYLLMPKKTPVYREGRAHEEFLGRLKDLWTSKEDFLSSFFNVLTDQYQLITVPYEEVMRLLHLPHRQATVKIDY